MSFLKKYHDYYLTRKIAAGGMAEIFRAWKTGEAGFEKQVVIKRMLTHLTTNKDFLSMFLSEAKLVSRLTHANIAQVYDLGKNQESEDKHPTYFIAMEFVFGKNLSQIIKRAQEQKKSLSWECMAGVCLGAAQALEYAHELKNEQGRPIHIVHRDISPQNILIAYSGEIKLVDFGIAKALVSRQETQAGTLKGKLSYMSPEQAMGEAVDQRSDIYSLGIVLWEMLTSHRLFTGDSEVGILHKIIKPQVDDPAVFRPDIPRPLAHVCMRCLQSDPEKRYQNALELINDLNAYLQQLPNFSGSLTLRRHMHSIFTEEMLLEKEQIQEELQLVRQAQAFPGGEPLTTVVIKPDGTLGMASDQGIPEMTGVAQPPGATSKTALTISAKIMRLANSMRTMTKRAVALCAASIVLLAALVSIVALWPEESERGLQHATPTIAAPPVTPDPWTRIAESTPDQDPSMEQIDLPDPTDAASVQDQDELPRTMQAAEGQEQMETTPDEQEQPVQPAQAAELKHPAITTQPVDIQTEATQATSAPPASAPVESPAPPPAAAGQVTATAKPAPTSSSDYNPLADPNLKRKARQFDQERFKKLQAEFQQGQFAALDSKQSASAMDVEAVGDTPPRIKVGQADVTIRLWRQSESTIEVEVLINDRPAAAGTKRYKVSNQPMDIPLRLQSGQNTVRLVHGVTGAGEGILLQVDKSPVHSLWPGKQGKDLIIVEY